MFETTGYSYTLFNTTPKHVYLKEKLGSSEAKLDGSLKSEQTRTNNSVLYGIAKKIIKAVKVITQRTPK